MFVGRKANILKHISQIQCRRTEGTGGDCCVLLLFLQYFSLALLFNLLPKYVLTSSFVFLKNCTDGRISLHPLSVFQASLQAWLGFDDYMGSVRQNLQGLLDMARMISPESDEGVVSDVTFAGIPVRVYEPSAGGEGHLRRGLMYYHGGGWTFGTASEYRHPCCLQVEWQEIKSEKAIDNI